MAPQGIYICVVWLCSLVRRKCIINSTNPAVYRGMLIFFVRLVFNDVLDVTKQLPLIPESYIEAATAEIEEEETTPGLPCNICKDNPLNSVVCCTTCKRRFCDHHAKVCN